jgi:hypothetical protein
MEQRSANPRVSAQAVELTKVEIGAGYEIWADDLEYVSNILHAHFPSVSLGAAIARQEPWGPYETMLGLLREANGRRIGFVRLEAEKSWSDRPTERLTLEMGRGLNEIRISNDSVLALGCAALIRRRVERRTQRSYKALAIGAFAVGGFAFVPVIVALVSWLATRSFDDQLRLQDSLARQLVVVLIAVALSLPLYVFSYLRINSTARSTGRFALVSVRRAVVLAAAALAGVLTQIVALVAAPAVAGLLRW